MRVVDQTLSLSVKSKSEELETTTMGLREHQAGALARFPPAHLWHLFVEWAALLE